MPKAIKTVGDFTEDPWRPGTRGRYQSVYEARDEKSARAQMAQDEKTLGPIHQKVGDGRTGYLRVVIVHWNPPEHRFGKGRLVVTWDLFDQEA